MNALVWINKEAKHLRRKYPHRFSEWKEYVAQASAIYAKKHKGKSPIGKKRKHTTVRHKRKVGAVRPIRTAGTVFVRTRSEGIGKIPEGRLKSELKSRAKERLKNALYARDCATTKTARRKIQKRITLLRKELK